MKIRLEKTANLKIGGLNYKIVYTDLDDCLGKTDFPTSTIYIDKKQNDNQKFATLVHEILHCLNNQMSEEKVEFLAQGINQVIRDNF